MGHTPLISIPLTRTMSHQLQVSSPISASARDRSLTIKLHCISPCLLYQIQLSYAPTVPPLFLTGHITRLKLRATCCPMAHWPLFLFIATKKVHTDLDQKEGWAPKKWCSWTVVLEKTLESPLDSKIKLVSPKGNQPWIFIGRIDMEAEVPILWPSWWKSRLIGKDSDARKDWRQEEQDDIGWDGCVVSPIQGKWAWANSRS